MIREKWLVIALHIELRFGLGMVVADRFLGSRFKLAWLRVIEDLAAFYGTVSIFVDIIIAGNFKDY